MLDTETLGETPTVSLTPKIRACLIVNPRSGRGGIDLSKVLPILEAHGWEVTIRHKLKGGMATAFAREAAQDGYDVVVNCGGDGTLREIIEGLVGTDVAVGCLPGGTVNLWTKELGISPRLDVATLQLIGSVRRRVDVGQVKVNGGKSHHFLLMAGLGFDGAVMSRVSKRLKNKVGRLAVGLAGLMSLGSFKPLPVRAKIGDLHWQGKTGQIVVGNTRLYGGFTRLTPQAFADDGLLDICLLTASDFKSLAGQLLPVMLQKQPNPASAEIYRSGRISVTSPRPLPMQLDGGAVKFKGKLPPGETTYDFSVIAQGVTMLVPAACRAEIFVGKKAALEFFRPEEKLAVKKEKNEPEVKSAFVKFQLQVVELGINTVTGARTKNGKVFLVAVGPDTILEQAGAFYKNITPIMAALRPGDLLEVSGTRDEARGRIVARRITLLTRNEAVGPENGLT